MREGILYKKNRKNPQVVKSNEVEIILHNLHADSLAGHFGIETTYLRDAIGIKFGNGHSWTVLEARAIPDVKAASVVQFFYEDIISRHGCPKVLLTDQGTNTFC